MRKYEFATCERIYVCKAGVCPFGRFSCLAHTVCCEGRSCTPKSKHKTIYCGQVTEPKAVEVKQIEPIKKTIKMKRCIICENLFVPKSNRSKYCKECAQKEQVKKSAGRQRKFRAKN